MIKEKYVRTELEIISLTNDDVITTSGDEEYEGWNPHDQSSTSGEYEGWNPH